MTMSAPGFTAEDSLQATRGHYRTSTRTPGPSAHAVGTIRLSEINVPGEVIEIEDDAPWSPPSWGGHTGPGTTSPPPETGGGEPGGGGGSEGGPTPEDSGHDPYPSSRGCNPHEEMSPFGTWCFNQFAEDSRNGVRPRYRHHLKCSGKVKGGVHEKVGCCQLKRVEGKDKEVCDPMTFV